MRVFKCLVMMFSLTVFVLSVPLIARADEWNKDTVMTFNHPVEVPNMVLKAGSYEFRLLGSTSDRHVVQILNADGTHLYENVLAIPAYRLEPSDTTVVTFEERAQGTPAAIATWFYPGDNSGVEFVYPKVNPADQLATATVTPAEPPLTPSQTASRPASTAAQTNAVQAKPASVVPITKHEPVQVAQATTQPRPEAASTATATHTHKEIQKKLPKTASPLQLLIVLGLLSLGGSVGIHVFSKQSV